MRRQPLVIITTILLLATAGVLHMLWSGAFGANFGAAQGQALISEGFLIEFDENVVYQSASDELGFYILERRSIRRYDVLGQRLWERTMSHASPVFAQGGHYIGLASYRTRTYYAFGPDGPLYTLNFDNDILSHHIACNGYSAIMSEMDDGSFIIEVFNNAGLRVKRWVSDERNLFPISMAISPDATMIVVSYLDVSQHVIMSYICAYYIQGDGGLFASFGLLEGEIISRVAFIDDKHLMFSSLEQFGVYRFGAEPRISHVWSAEFANRAAFVEVVRGAGIAVAYGAPRVGAEGLEEGAFVIYGIDRSELATYFMQGGIKYMSASAGAVIIGGGPLSRDFAAIDYRGRVVWNYTATSDVLDFVILDTPERALIATPIRMQIMELR